MSTSDSHYFVRRAADELRRAEAAATAAAAVAHYEMAQAYIERAGLAGLVATPRAPMPTMPRRR